MIKPALWSLVLLCACVARPQPTQDAVAVSELRTRPQTLAVAPNPAPLVYGGQAQQFVATLNGRATAATWSLNYGLGTISASGLYRAPADQAGWNTVVVTATVGGQSVSVPQGVGPAPAPGTGGTPGSGGSGSGGSSSGGALPFK